MVNFSVGPQDPCDGQMLNFTDQSNGATSWEWDFDNDGIVDDTTQNPTACHFGDDVTLTINGNVSITKPVHVTYSTQCASNDCVNGGGDNGARLAKEAKALKLTAYPNPFSNHTNISYFLSESGEVTVEIFDLQGRLVSSPLKTVKKIAGTHQLNISQSLSQGIYICVVTTNGKKAFVKLFCQ
jgi:hypothetical protein